MLFLVFGLSVGSVIGFTSIGLIGGLIGILLFNRKIVKFPNIKIAIFIGYIAFLIIFFLLPFLLSIPSYSYSGSSMSFLLLFLSIPFIHCVITIGFFILLQNRNAFNSNYFAFITAYFLASLVLTPFMLFTGLFGLFGGYSTVIDPLRTVTTLIE